MGGLLRAIDAFTGQANTKVALRLLPHVFVRPGELRSAEWTELDLDAAVWTIPAEKMKMRRPHAIPLSRQAIEIGLPESVESWILRMEAEKQQRI